MAASALPLFFFAFAIALYLKLGYFDTTDNQPAERNFTTTVGTAILAISEVGGFSILFIGFLVARFG